MEFLVMVKSYNRYGGHTTLSRIGDFLLMGANNFGDGIKELTITLYLSDSGPSKRTLDQCLESHNRNRSTLPKVTYRKEKGKLEINIASDIIDARDWKPSPRPSLPLFERGVEEIIGALPLIRRRLKDSDAFDFEAFLAHCEVAQQHIPNSESALEELVSELRETEKAKRDVMSPWEKLGIDWQNFHANAREVLDDPFFWDCTDDFSPNGNDTGADLLEAYRDWLKGYKDGQPIRFLERLAKQWGYSSIESMDHDVRAEAAVALAFADLKLRATCNAETRKLAIEAIEQQRRQAEASTGWSSRQERLSALAKIERKLRQNG